MRLDADISDCGTEMGFNPQNKDLSKETRLHLLIFQSWCVWGWLGVCHSPLPNGQTLNMFFFSGEDRGQHKDGKKKAVTVFQTKGSQQCPLCPQHHFRNTFATILLEHQTAGTSQNMHFFATTFPRVCPGGCKEIPQVWKDNSHPRILSMRIFFNSFIPSNARRSTKLNHLYSANRNRNETYANLDPLL